MQFHYKPDLKTARKPVARSPSDTLQPASLLGPPAADPGVFVVNNSVLAGQFDQNLLHQGLVSQAVLPASVSGKRRVGRVGGWGGRVRRAPGALLCQGAPSTPFAAPGVLTPGDTAVSPWVMSWARPCGSLSLVF